MRCCAAAAADLHGGLRNGEDGRNVWGEMWLELWGMQIGPCR
jgi:hypothetical protein